MKFGVATYNRFREAGRGEDMVDFYLAHSSFKAALGVSRLADKIQTWTCWGMDNPIIVVDMKKY
jgi:hypothetical protein